MGSDLLSELHMLACEYPPQIGGVSNYAASVAGALALTGQSVHVWCPPADDPRPAPVGVTVHGELGRFGPADLRRVGRMLDEYGSPRRLLVQWVPHGYGYRSMNLPFCFWIRKRARKGDRVDLMVHEPFLSFEGSWKQKAAAAVHRAMTMVLLRAANRVWISTPAWRAPLQAFAGGRDVGFDWLPIPSPVQPVDDEAGVVAARSRYASPGDHVIGHFGLYSRLTGKPMQDVVIRLLGRLGQGIVLLMGEGSSLLRDRILAQDPALAPRVHATGVLELRDLSLHIQACDVFVQPYPEGITTRRTSTMAPLAHGKAVVTTEGPSTESLWRERNAVSLVPCEAGAIVQEIERLLAEPAARKELGVRARMLYTERFGVERTAAALIADCR